MAQNINIGTADNAKDGQTLREAFRRIRKNFAEIWGDTDAANLTDTEDLPSASYDSIITEKIEDTVDAMFSGGTHTNITVTYDDSDGTLDLNVAADITDVNAGAGMTGTNEGGGAATLNVIGGDGITVNADEVEATVDDTTIELSASDGTGALRVKDGGITLAKMAANSVDSDQYVDGSIDNAHLADNAVDHDELANRYTASSAETSAATLSLNKNDADTFTWTAGHSVTVSFTNVKVGDTATLVVTGGGSSYTFALSQINSASATFNKISGTYDDTSGTKNLIEFKFVSTSEAWYQISQIAS